METTSLQIISIAVSVLALSGSLLTYLVHERKLKAQESKINTYQLRKFEEEEREAKKAQVRANLISDGRNKYTLKVYNKGKAQARNIRLNVLEPADYDMDILANPFPIPMLSEQDGIGVSVYPDKESPDQVTIRLEWDDDFRSDNTHEQIIVF